MKKIINKNHTTKLLALIIALSMLLLAGCSEKSKSDDKSTSDPDSIVTKNSDGDYVFTMDLDEYLNEYCYQLEQYGSDMDLGRDDFEFVEYDGAQFYYLDMQAGNLTFYADEDGENFSIMHFMIYDTPDEVPVGILCMLRALYPDDSVEDMNEAYWNAEDNGSATYKDVKIVFDGTDDLESWSIEINK